MDSTPTIAAPIQKAPPSRLAGRIGPLLFAALLLGIILWFPYAAGYADHRLTLRIWITGPWASATWQHSALALPIAIFLVWRKRHTLAALAVKPSVTGLLLAILAMFSFWMGHRGNFYYLGYAGLHLLIAATVVWLWGWKHLRCISFALAMLTFVWPLVFMEDFVAFKLRFLMVTITDHVLNGVGVPTLQEGTRLLSAASEGRAVGDLFKMNIDGPCSGLRSLYALMMVSALFGYFRQRSWWRRSSLFILSIPLAVISNALRIMLLTFATIMFGENFALGNGEEYTSNFHLLTGLFMFAISLGGLILAEKILNRFFKKERPLPLTEDS